MRILYVLHQFYPEFSSGTEQVALNLCKSAQRAGHYAHVLACAINPSVSNAGPLSEYPEFLQTVYQGVPVTLVPRHRLSPFAEIGFVPKTALADRLARWMEGEHFDVCHILHTMRMGEALVAMKKCGLPYLITLTDFFAPCYRINFMNNDNTLCKGSDGGERCVKDCIMAPWTSDSLRSRHVMAQNLLAGACRLVCPSEYVALRYREAFPGLKFLVIPHGIDFSAFAESDLRSRGDEASLVLGYIGTMVQQKGLDVLLHALGRLPDANIRLRLCGGSFRDPLYEREIRRLVAQDCRVEWMGQLEHDRIPSMIRSLDVLCLPSRVPETFSIVLHEAYAAGVPALVSNLGAPGELVGNSGFGRTIPVDDVGAWAAAIADLLADRSTLLNWREQLPLPLRVEEEGFFYDSLYRELRQSVL